MQSMIPQSACTLCRELTLPYHQCDKLLYNHQIAWSNVHVKDVVTDWSYMYALAEFLVSMFLVFPGQS